jgi:hypothetical protein
VGQFKNGWMTETNMALKPKHPPGPPMTLGNMREMGVQNLIASCVNDACRPHCIDRRVELPG